MRAFTWIDRHWPSTLVVLAVGVAVSYQTWAERSPNPILIGRLDQSTRSILYGSLAGSAGALLGLTIATLAILLTLDDSREAVSEMRQISAWRVMNVTLLFAVGSLGATLALATFALGVDSHPAPNEQLELAVTAVASLAFAELAAGCIAFAIVVLNLTRKLDQRAPT